MKKINEWKVKYLKKGWMQILFILVLAVTMIMLPGELRILNGESLKVGFYEKKFILLIMTLGAAYFIGKIDYRFWARFSVVYYFMGLIQVLLLGIYGISNGSGAVRWLEWSGFSFNGEMLIMVAIVVVLPYCANIVPKKGGSNKHVVAGMLMMGSALAIPLLVMCNDIGSWFVVTAVTVIVALYYVTEQEKRVYLLIISSIPISAVVGMIACYRLCPELMRTYSKIIVLAGLSVAYMLIYLKKRMDKELTKIPSKCLVFAVMTRIMASYMLLLVSEISNIARILSEVQVFERFTDTYLFTSMMELGFVFSAVYTSKKIREKVALKGNEDDRAEITKKEVDSDESEVAINADSLLITEREFSKKLKDAGYEEVEHNA